MIKWSSKAARANNSNNNAICSYCDAANLVIIKVFWLITCEIFLLITIIMTLYLIVIILHGVKQVYGWWCPMILIPIFFQCNIICSGFHMKNIKQYLVISGCHLFVIHCRTRPFNVYLYFFHHRCIIHH